jgi:hypothetical protein
VQSLTFSTPDWEAMKKILNCPPIARNYSKDSKRGRWHWEQTKMTDPARAEWLWLIIAVATLWTVAVGCAAEHAAEQAPQRVQMRQTAAGAT